MKTHPAADLFPMLSEDELVELAEDIAANGLHNRLTAWYDPKTKETVLLDGRNRLAACEKAGVETEFETFEGTPAEAVSYVLSQNVYRRHLSTSQRSLIAAELAQMQGGLTQPQAAALMNVSPRGVANGIKVLNEGTPEEIAAVKEDKAPVTGTAQAVAERVRTNSHGKAAPKGSEGLISQKTWPALDAKAVLRSINGMMANGTCWFEGDTRFSLEALLQATHTDDDKARSFKVYATNVGWKFTGTLKFEPGYAPAVAETPAQAERGKRGGKDTHPGAETAETPQAVIA